MEIINITNDGEFTIELTDEEARLLIQKAITDILREEIENYEQPTKDSRPPEIG